MSRLIELRSIVAVAVFLGAAALWGWYLGGDAANSIVYEKPGLRFSTGECGRSAGPGERDNIKSREWRRNGLLVVEAGAIATCGAGPDNGDYSVSGNTIALTYGRSAPVDKAAACECAYTLKYEISGLVRSDYQVTIQRAGRSTARDAALLFGQAQNSEAAGRMEEAIAAYYQSARAGDARAAWRLGQIHAGGIGGVPQDNVEGLKWYNAARVLGYKEPSARDSSQGQPLNKP